MQSGNTRGMTILAREDRFHSRGPTLQQCAREARVLDDNSRVLLEYSKTTREFYSSTRRQLASLTRVLEGNTRYFVNFDVTGTIYTRVLLHRSKFQKYIRAGGSNFTLVRQNTTDKKSLDSVCISLYIMEHASHAGNISHA